MEVEVRGVERYWNPILETLPPLKLKAYQFKKFKRIIAWAYEKSKLYRSIYDKAGFKPEHLKKWDDISKVPIVEKEDYLTAQAKEPWPYGDSLCVPLEKVTTYHQTSGITGQPVYQPETWQDWEWWSETWAFALWAHGFRNNDRVLIPFGYNVYMASWAGHYASEKIGCEVVPGGILNTEERILKMRELGVTSFMATPSYALNMAEVCRNNLGMDPREMGIKKILCSGEPGASVPNIKKRIEEVWNTKVYDQVSATEVGGWAYECASQPEGLHVNEAFFLVELVDVDTREPIEELNVPGKIVITAFDQYAQPCIRFDTKDISMWGKPCDCGRTFRILKDGIHGRVDHITKIKGVLFNPVSVEDVVRSTPELGDEYEIIVKKEREVDEVTLRVELAPDVSIPEDEIKRKLSRQLRLKTNLSFNLELLPPHTLPRPEVKVKRFKDYRI